jgi:hypothetical protein
MARRVTPLVIRATPLSARLTLLVIRLTQIAARETPLALPVIRWRSVSPRSRSESSFPLSWPVLHWRQGTSDAGRRLGGPACRLRAGLCLFLSTKPLR